MKTSRRGFLRGFGGIAAASIAAKGFGLSITQSEEQRLRDMMQRDRVIRGETLLFDDGLVFDWQDSDIILDHCDIYFRRVTRPDMIRLKNVAGVRLESCRLQALTKSKVRSYLCADKECGGNTLTNCTFDGLDADYGIFCEGPEVPKFHNISLNLSEGNAHIGQCRPGASACP